MHGHAGDIGAAHLDLAGVNTHPHLDAKLTDRVDDRVRTVDGDAGTGERRDESVTGGVHFATAESLEFVADDPVVVVEQVPPVVVAECGGALGGADDVGENDCGEHTLGVEAAARAGDELLDLVEHRRGVTGPVQGIGARHFDIACVRDVLGQVAAMPDADEPGVFAMHDQRRRGDAGECVAHVGCGQHLADSAGLAG